MNRLLAVSAVLLVLGSAPVAGQAPSAPEWSPLSLHVEKAGPLGTRFGSEVAVATQGTRVVALLHLPGQFITGVDRRGCKLDLFTDDKGTDLLQALQGGRRNPGGLVEREELTPDGKYCRLS